MVKPLYTPRTQMQHQDDGVQGGVADQGPGGGQVVPQVRTTSCAQGGRAGADHGRDVGAIDDSGADRGLGQCDCA